MKKTDYFLLVAPACAVFLAISAPAQTFTNLHSFSGIDGAAPISGLIASGGVLYGTAQFGGTNYNGGVFSINTNGTGFTNLYSFTATDTNGNNGDGANPVAGLILSGGTLYGTTQAGGSNGNGTVFKINADGTSFSVIHTFSALDPATETTNSDGASPTAGLFLAGNTLFGTAPYGGTNGTGTLFALTTNATGFTTLYNFSALNFPFQFTNGDGAFPAAALVLSGANLYGTAQYGGTNGDGTIFKINTNGTGFKSLYSFTGSNDGANPQAGFVLSGNTLYGTTPYGGASQSGTVFKITTAGTGFQTLYGFTGGDDGQNPVAVLALSGNSVYGTAPNGGISGDGTAFTIDTNGTAFMTIYAFTPASTNSAGIYTNADGTGPTGGLLLSAGTLYGTAESGGTNGAGTVFSLSTNLAGSYQVYGYVHDGIGNPLSSLYVYADDGLGHFDAAATDTNGFYSINVVTGSWDVHTDCSQLSSQNYDCPGHQAVSVSVASVEADFTVQACSQLQATATNLPNGVFDIYYDQQLGALSCNPPVSWSLHSGPLPPGLQLSPGGELSGTPTNGGAFNFSVTLTDSHSNSTNQSLSLTIIAPTATIVSHPAITNGLFQFTVDGESGQNFTVEFSTNLTDWATLLITNLTGGHFLFTFPPATNQLGFYRAFESGLVITDFWSGPVWTAPVISFASQVSHVDVPDGRAIVSISRSGGITNEVCVGYATTDGTARAGVDYTPVSGTLCFEPNQTNASITIPLLISTNSPSSETVDLILYDTNRTAVLNSAMVILFPQLLGTWYGSWAGTNGALICGGRAIPVPAPYGGGTWTLVMQQVDWPDRMAQGTFFMQGNEYARNTTNDCILCCLTEFFPAYQTSQIVSNIVVDSSGRVTIGNPTSNLGHGGFDVIVGNPGPDLGVDFAFDTLNEVVQGSFTSEYGSIVGGAATNGAWSHLGWVSGERISPTR